MLPRRCGCWGLKRHPASGMLARQVLLVPSVAEKLRQEMLLSGLGLAPLVYCVGGRQAGSRAGKTLWEEHVAA